MDSTTASLYLDGPFATYLAATNEKRLFTEHFTPRFHRFKAARIYDRQVRVLDVGCGDGATSQLNMQMLSNRGQKFHYTAVDPHQAQLDRFANTVPVPGGSSLTCIQGDLESFEPNPDDKPFDLVIAYQMLYHVPNLTAALRKILGLGREVLIGHHGRRGIHQVQEHFREHVTGGPHIISTDSEIEAILAGLTEELGERHFERTGFVAKINVSSCFQLKNNRDLAAFFLQCDPALITPDLLSWLRLYLVDLIGLNYNLPHDVGLFTVTDLAHPGFPPA